MSQEEEEQQKEEEEEEEEEEGREGGLACMEERRREPDAQHVVLIYRKEEGQQGRPWRILLVRKNFPLINTLVCILHLHSCLLLPSRNRNLLCLHIRLY